MTGQHAVDDGWVVSETEYSMMINSLQDSNVLHSEGTSGSETSRSLLKASFAAES